MKIRNYLLLLPAALLLSGVCYGESDDSCGRYNYIYHQKNNGIEGAVKKIEELPLDQFKDTLSSENSELISNIACQLDKIKDSRNTARLSQIEYVVFLKIKQDALLVYLKKELRKEEPLKAELDELKDKNKKADINKQLQELKKLKLEKSILEESINASENQIGEWCAPEDLSAASLAVLKNRSYLERHGICSKNKIEKRYGALYAQLKTEVEELEKRWLSKTTDANENSDLKKKVEALNQMAMMLGEDGVSIDSAANHDGFPGYFTVFYAGVEFQNIDTLFDKGVPRVGLMVYRKPGDPDVGRGAFRPKNWHVFSNFLVTGVGEIAEDEQVQLADEEIEKGIEANINLFVPTNEFDLGFHQLLGGPILSLGGSKIEKQQVVTRRQYVGWRTALEPEVFTEFLVGKTETLISNRAEVRVQMAVPGLSPSTKLFLGAIINLGVHGHEEAEEGDVLRVYVKWNSPFSSFYIR